MADSTKKTGSSGSRSRSRSGTTKRTGSASSGSRKRATSRSAAKTRSSGSSRRTTSGTRSKQQQDQGAGLGTGKLVAIGAAVGGLAGTVLLLRKLRQHTSDEELEDDERYDEDDYDDDEPRGQADEEDDVDDEEDSEEDDEDDDEPRAGADLDEDDEDEEWEGDDEEEDEQPASRASSHESNGDDESERGLAATVWEAVVEGVRSSQGAKTGKTAGGRAESGEEDDDSDPRPRGGGRTGHRKAGARAPRGKQPVRARTREDEQDGGGDVGTAVLRQARRHLAELTGREAESVSGLEHDGEGRTRVRLEVVELDRIPHTTDVLATYELSLDDQGRLLDCSRVARYSRSSSEGATL